MTLADKTATAVTTCALAIALGLVGQAGQAGEQSAQTGLIQRDEVEGKETTVIR